MRRASSERPKERQGDSRRQSRHLLRRFGNIFFTRLPPRTAFPCQPYRRRGREKKAGGLNQIAEYSVVPCHGMLILWSGILRGDNRSMRCPTRILESCNVVEP